MQDNSDEQPLWNWRNINPLWIGAALFLLAVLLRFYGLGTRGLWYDEIVSYTQPLMDQHGSMDGPTVIGIYWFVNYWVASGSDVMLHMIPAFFGALAVYLVFLLCLVEIGLWPAVFAAAAFCVSPLAVFYAQEARPYGFFMAAAALLLLVYFRVRRRPSAEAWTLYSACLALTLGIHLAGLVFVAAFLVVALWDWRAASKNPSSFLMATFLGAFIGASWLGGRPAVDSGFTWQFILSPMEYVRTLLVAFGPLHVYPRQAAPSVFDAIGIIYALIAIWGARELWRERTQREFFIVCVGSIVIGASALFVTIGDRAGWTWLRYICYLTIPYYCLLGYGVHVLMQRVKYLLLKGLIPVLFVAGFAPGVLQNLNYAHHSRARMYQDWTLDIASLAGELAGVLILPENIKTMSGPSDRIANIYTVYKRDGLPDFQLSEGKFLPLKKSLAYNPFSFFVEVDVTHPQDPTPGHYAMFGRDPFTDCASLFASDSAYQASTVMVGKPANVRVTVCSVQKK